MSAPIRSVIVDDEPLARAGLKAALASDADLLVVGECEDGVDALARVPRLCAELLLLDVQMPGLDGFEVLRRLPNLPPAVIFVTAHDSYALRAFESEALDYLLKPYDDERLARALARVKAKLRAPRVDDLARKLSALLSEQPGQKREADKLVIRDGSSVHFVPLDEIAWIRAQDYYAELHCAGRTHLLREPLRDLVKRLDPERFMQIHRSVIVQLSRVVELRATDGGEALAVLSDGTALPISRARRSEVYARLGVASPRP
jgi:two-component system LytT family response regulator